MQKDKYLKKYFDRLMEYDRGMFLEFEDAYISSYDVYTTTDTIYEFDHRLCNPANVLMNVCKKKK